MFRTAVVGILAAVLLGFPVLVRGAPPGPTATIALTSSAPSQAQVNSAAAYLDRLALAPGRPTLEVVPESFIAEGHDPSPPGFSFAGERSEDHLYVTADAETDWVVVFHELLHGSHATAYLDFTDVQRAQEEAVVEAVAEDLTPAYGDRHGLSYTTDGSVYGPQVTWVRWVSGQECAAAGLDPRVGKGCARGWRQAFLRASADERQGMVDSYPEVPPL